MIAQQGAAGPTGPAGAGTTGATGAAGATGVAGPNWRSTLQFTTFTVLASNTLAVPSGTVIRATGNVTIAGTISVATNLYSMALIQGIGSTPGLVDAAGGTVVSGGAAVNALTARLLVLPGAIGGGIGPCTGSGAPAVITNGGGTITIIAAGSITINSGAFIHADGTAGCAVNPNTTGGGGGGGGVLVLASKTSITNSGTLTAVRGAGANSISGTGASGGGGGGVINLLSPSNTGAGTLTVTGGAAGTGADSSGFAGSGGGSGGAGGHSGTSTPAAAGGLGQTFAQTIVDPASLLAAAAHIY
jgi:hypothetical protein